MAYAIQALVEFQIIHKELILLTNINSTGFEFGARPSSDIHVRFYMMREYFLRYNVDATLRMQLRCPKANMASMYNFTQSIISFRIEFSLVNNKARTMKLLSCKCMVWLEKLTICMAHVLSRENRHSLVHNYSSNSLTYWHHFIYMQPIDYCPACRTLYDRNKILSGGDLSHYQVLHCIRVFFYFV